MYNIFTAPDSVCIRVTANCELACSRELSKAGLSLYLDEKLVGTTSGDSVDGSALPFLSKSTLMSSNLWSPADSTAHSLLTPIAVSKL